MQTYGVIMAGGGGTRFWPLSRKEKPKQFLNLSGKESMVNETIDRLAQSIAMKDIFVVTNAAQAPLMVQETKGRLCKEHILAEPAARNTAACIGYAAMEIIKKYEDGIMCIVPSDAFIKDRIEFSNVINAALKAAAQMDKLITIGITPTFPATGYGYIKGQADVKTQISGCNDRYYSPVIEFVEKPELETAKKYVEAGNYMWNSGMFVWKASTILKKMKELLPDIYDCLVEIGDAMGSNKEQEVLERVYPQIPKISIDYGIMERSKDVIVLEGDFGWNDVGSLDMLRVVKGADANGNVLYGEQINIDTNNCISYGTDKLIATIGLDNLIVVQTDDVVLVCDKDRAQDVKQVVDELELQKKHQYL